MFDAATPLFFLLGRRHRARIWTLLTWLGLQISKAKKQIDGLAELNDDMQEQNAVMLKAISDLKQPNGKPSTAEAAADATA